MKLFLYHLIRTVYYKKKYYNIGNSARYLVQTWPQAKSHGIKQPEVHDISKSFNPNIQPEKQVRKPLIKKFHK